MNTSRWKIQVQYFTVFKYLSIFKTYFKLFYSIFFYLIICRKYLDIIFKQNPLNVLNFTFHCQQVLDVYVEKC